MGCNCKEGNIYQIGFGCCRPSIIPADDFYTKPQIDEMLDEIESAITSGCCITPEEVDEKIAEAVSGKQDTLIAGDNITISGNVISSVGGSGSTGCNCDLSDYVTFEDMGEYIGDVYTKTEVNNLFVTKELFITTIYNLNQQIESLKEAISGCCGSTGETEYRWIVVPNDYTCSGTTKMTKEKQQSSVDGGITWVDTGQYRTGSTVLEYDSTDCGYAPSSNYKVKANYKRGYTVGSGQVECNTSTTLTNDEIKEQITFPAYFTSIEFGSCIDTIGENALLNATDILGTVDIPSNVVTIEKSAFGKCKASAYTLHEGLVTIGNLAFVDNINLIAITIPNSVTSIGQSAFDDCTNLRTVTIGSGVTNIGNAAFLVAANVEDVKITSFTINAITPPSFEVGTSPQSTFIGTYPIYVPAQSVNAYKTAQYWSELADRIQAIP